MLYKVGLIEKLGYTLGKYTIMGVTRMSFYEELSNYYHIIFPPQPTQLQFLSEEFTKAGAGKKVLDVACAIGGYSFALAEKGFSVVGFDLEEKMINIAKDKKAELEQSLTTNSKPGIKADFYTGDMRQAGQFGNDFQGLFCIGNSFAHLTEDQDLRQAAHGFCQALVKGGVAIVQVVNFDRIIRYGVDSLPTIDKEEASLIRNYNHLENGLIDFQTVLTVKDGVMHQEFHNSVELTPLLKKDMAEIFTNAGFSRLTFYGAFDRREHSDDSPATIMVATK